MKTNTAVKSILTPEQEEKRKEIVDLELKARYWRAQFDIRFYTLESEKLQKDYDSYLDAQRKMQEEQMARFQAEVEKMTEAKKAELDAQENLEKSI